MQNDKPNRLVNELSPYLLQHAYNPVNWYPWCDEAFERAKKEEKPIFLSIGYSTCHWCHVMENESFVNKTTAGILNRNFISIKVDREEQPDIDNIYMLACQMMTGSGGWPLSLFLTPDKIPFFAGTYFPNESRYGKIGFNDLLDKVHIAWLDNRDELEKASNENFSLLIKHSSDKDVTEIPAEIFQKAYKYFEGNYDPVYGGFGSSPKFPSPHNLIFLLRYWKYFDESKALLIVNKTLTELHKGGIYDQIGYGFHRYSTDRQWLVPHFEKMLYDQALLMLAYTEAYHATGNEEFKKVVEEIHYYIVNNMTDSNGGFYSAEDADSEGEEGKFYFWTDSDLSLCLDNYEKQLAVNVFNIGSGLEEREKIPHRNKSFVELAIDLNKDLKSLLEEIENIRTKMFDHRRKRIHPFKDDKTLSDWNGLMIGALARASRVLKNNSFVTAAENAFHFIERKLITDGIKLKHMFRHNEAKTDGNLDDYAFLAFALLELYSSTFKAEYLIRATELVKYSIEHFWDEKGSGFYFTQDTSEGLIIRTKEIYDGAIPSGNSVMLNNLVMLYHFTADKIYFEYASKSVDSFSEYISKSPYTSTFYLYSYHLLNSEKIGVMIIGNPEEQNVKSFLTSISSKYLPNLSIIIHDRESKEYNLPFEYLNNYEQINSQPTFYVCKHFTCNLPTNDFQLALKQVAL